MAGVVAARFEAAYGGPVGLLEANIGFRNSSLRGLKLFEEGAAPSDAPWLEVDSVQSDISIWSLIGGQSDPEELTLQGGAITLRFDSAGHLLTNLPRHQQKGEKLPARVHIQDGRFTLKQDGHADFVVTGVNARVRDIGDRLSLGGSITDPCWGDLKLSASFGKEFGDFYFELEAPQAHVTQAMLDKLPFVPAKVWKQVQCEGDTPVSLTATYLHKSREEVNPTFRQISPKFQEEAMTVAPNTVAAPLGFHYRIVLDPVATQVHVTSIDLHASQAHGRVIIEDKVVRLQGVHGYTADGEIETDAVLDFNVKPAQLRFAVHVKQIDLQKLPRGWRLPAQVAQHLVTGRLSGDADLKLAVADGKARTSGQGEGAITETRLAGIPFKKPIKLTLHANGNGFGFNIRGVPLDIGIKMPRRDPVVPAPAAEGKRVP